MRICNADCSTHDAGDTTLAFVARRRLFVAMFVDTHTLFHHSTFVKREINLLKRQINLLKRQINLHIQKAEHCLVQYVSTIWKNTVLDIVLLFEELLLQASW